MSNPNGNLSNNPNSKDQMQGGKKKNWATLLNKFDYNFEKVINKINKFIWKKGWFCKRNFIALEKCVKWKIQIQILFINDFEVI